MEFSEITRVITSIDKAWKRGDALRVVPMLTDDPPEWFVTNKPYSPDSDKPIMQEAFEYTKGVYGHDPFCGFAKIRFDLTNVSDKPIYIERVNISRGFIFEDYQTRLRTMPQGEVGPLNYYSILDDDMNDVSKEFARISRDKPGFFGQSNRIKIDPDETEIAIIEFIALLNSYNVNVQFIYSISGKHRSTEYVIKDGFDIVAFNPERIENDFSPFTGQQPIKDVMQDINQVFVRLASDPSEENLEDAISVYRERL